mgnify:CR=1 FL=1
MIGTSDGVLGRARRTAARTPGGAPLLLAAAGAVALLLATDVGRLRQPDLVWGAAAVLAYLLASVASTLVHELGHVALGAVVGQRLHAMGLGPLRLARYPTWRLTVHGRATDAGPPSAWVLLVPRTIDGLGWRTAATVAGGPAASAACTALAAWAYVARGGFDRVLAARAVAVESPWAALGALLVPCVAIVAGITAIGTLTFPARGASVGDGWILLRLASRRTRAETVAALTLQALQQAGVPAVRWPPAIAHPPADSRPTDHLSACAALLRAQHALHRGEHERAERLLETVLDAGPPRGIPRTPVLLEAAVVAALRGHDIARAERRLREAAHDVPADHAYLWARALGVLAGARGDSAAALHHLRRSRDLLRARGHEPAWTDEIALAESLLRRAPSAGAPAAALVADRTQPPPCFTPSGARAPAHVIDPSPCAP